MTSKNKLRQYFFPRIKKQLSKDGPKGHAREDIQWIVYPNVNPAVGNQKGNKEENKRKFFKPQTQQTRKESSQGKRVGSMSRKIAVKIY